MDRSDAQAKSFVLKVKAQILPAYAKPRHTRIEHMGLYFGENNYLILEAPISHKDLVEFIEYMHGQIRNGWRLLTWGGTFYDLQILADESGQRSRMKEISWKHTDIRLHMICFRHVAPSLSFFQEYDPNSLRSLLKAIYDFAQRAEREGEIRWTVDGMVSIIPMPEDGWITVEQSAALEKVRYVSRAKSIPPWLTN